MPQQTAQATVIKASYLLQAKVGRGPLDQQTVSACQVLIDKNEVDFVPLGMEYLNELASILKETGQLPMNATALCERLIQPVMQLKANGAMFGYHLIGSLAEIMLSFLESIDEVDKDALEIVRVHHSTLKAIITKRMVADDGAYGTAFQRELKDACKRYFEKQKLEPREIFYVDA